jgi:hypothetical protein
MPLRRILRHILRANGDSSYQQQSSYHQSYLPNTNAQGHSYNATYGQAPPQSIPGPASQGHGYHQLTPETFWGQLVDPQGAASRSLQAFAGALYSWADGSLMPQIEGGLSPEKVGELMKIGEYSIEHNICKPTPVHLHTEKEFRYPIHLYFCLPSGRFVVNVFFRL